MIASFMINPEQQVCLAQFGKHQKITGLRIASGSLCMIIMEDEHEEMFTEEIHQNVLSALKNQDDILIAHIDDDGEPIDEYAAPVSFDL